MSGPRCWSSRSVTRRRGRRRRRRRRRPGRNRSRSLPPLPPTHPPFPTVGRGRPLPTVGLAPPPSPPTYREPADLRKRNLYPSFFLSCAKNSFLFFVYIFSRKNFSHSKNILTVLLDPRLQSSVMYHLVYLKLLYTLNIIKIFNMWNRAHY